MTIETVNFLLVFLLINSLALNFPIEFKMLIISICFRWVISEMPLDDILIDDITSTSNIINIELNGYFFEGIGEFLSFRLIFLWGKNFLSGWFHFTQILVGMRRRLFVFMGKDRKNIQSLSFSLMIRRWHYIISHNLYWL